MSYFYGATLNGQLEYSSSDLNDFLHYQAVYKEEHEDENVEYFVLDEVSFYERFNVEPPDDY